MATSDAIQTVAPIGLPGRAAAITAAFDLLDEKGFERLSLSRLAERLQLDGTMMRRHFQRRRDLVEAMAATMMRAADTPIAANAGWEDVLRHRAATARRAMLSRRDGAMLAARAAGQPNARDRACLAALISAGFAEDHAEAAIELIDRFTLGWTMGEQSGRAPCEPEARFAAHLDTLLRALAPAVDLPADAPEAATGEPQMLQIRLWNVLRATRESAEIAYARTMQLIELDRRILLLLESHGDLVPAEVSASMGVDKAQVSRSVKRLEELGLITRGGVRSPLGLTREGRALTERMMRLAELRNRELTFGVSDEQLVHFFAVLEKLMARAVLLLEQERKLMSEGRTEGPLDYRHREADSPHAPIVVERARILPPLITLNSYSMRSGALAWKRLTGLSNFEAWVLTDICVEAPLDWQKLVQAINRDQSQAGRTVKRLMEMGLVERSGAPARRHGSFAPTDEGRRVHALIHHAAQQRSAYLVQDLSPSQLAGFFQVFDIIAHNADAQLSRERALDEMGAKG